MAAFRWIQMSSLLMLMLQFKGTTEQRLPTHTVAAGRDVTLPCKNLKQSQGKCRSTNWLFSNSRNVEELFELRKNKEAKPKSGRLSLSVNCSLVIKKVKDQDAGLYTCRRYKNERDHEDSGIQLSVINSKNAATTKKTIIRTLPTTQSAKPTMKINTWTTEGAKTSEWITVLNSPAVLAPDRQWLIIASVGLASFLITVVVIIRWKKAKENKRLQGNNTGPSLNPTDTQCGPGTSRDTTEVSYASISFTRKTNNTAQACGDDGHTVTYSTVKASSSSAGVSTDPSDLYCTINKASKCS